MEAYPDAASARRPPPESRDTAPAPRSWLRGERRRYRSTMAVGRGEAAGGRAGTGRPADQGPPNPGSWLTIYRQAWSWW